ncbi:MAG TPA: hypothetical protein VMX79_00620 [bacterium]|nr:hypothetical protein [bacterium]
MTEYLPHRFVFVTKERHRLAGPGGGGEVHKCVAAAGDERIFDARGHCCLE